LSPLQSPFNPDRITEAVNAFIRQSQRQTEPSESLQAVSEPGLAPGGRGIFLQIQQLQGCLSRH
jgi:hypothetical protein